MKHKIQVSLIQFNPELLQLDKNIDRMHQFALKEAKEGAEIIVFPELSNLGYVEPVSPGETVSIKGLSYEKFACQYAEVAEPLPGPTTKMFMEITKSYGIYVVAGIAQINTVVPATLYNSAVLIGPQGIIGVYQKIHLWRLEKLYFYPGNSAEVYATELGNIGLQICYDVRFPEMSRILALKGAEIICSLWASSFPVATKNPEWEMLKYRTFTRAQENGLYFISCNRAGDQGENRFMGHSVIASPSGIIIASSKSTKEEVIRAEIRKKEIFEYRSTVGVFRDRRPELYDLISAPLSGSHLLPDRPEQKSDEPRE